MAILTVTTTADSGAGSLRAAIASAQSGDTIQFSSSLANQTITLTSGQIEISVGKNLVIDGASAANLTLSGNNASRILLLNSTSATPTSLTIKNLTLANGYTADRGGAISTTHQGKLTVERVAFKNNVADDGGGAIFSAYEGQLTVLNSQFTGNKAIKGNDERGAGAIAFWGPRELTVKNSEFVNNQGINGGAINSLNGKLLIENSKFINNSTLAAKYDTGKGNPSLRGYGGAIYTDRASSINEASGSIQILGSVFEGNQGRGEGGAAYLYTGTQDQVKIASSLFRNNSVQALDGGNKGNGGAIVQITNGLNKGLAIANTSFVNNSSTNQGGGIWVMGAPTIITNSTFSDNKAIGNTSSTIGGAMALYSKTALINSTIANNYAGWVGGGVSVSGSTEATLQNTIFYNNSADNGSNDWGIQQHTSGQFVDKGGNLQWPSNQTKGSTNAKITDQIRLVDPLLGPLQDNGGGLPTYALLPNSPAINAGTLLNAPEKDQRGALRDANPDSGAVEFALVFQLIGDDDSNPLTGTDSSDSLGGEGGDDVLIGLGGNDALIGGIDRDRLEGGNGRDRLSGGEGDDILIGGAARDVLNGGAGRDRFVMLNFKDKVDVIEDFERRDKIDLSEMTGKNFRSRNPFDYIRLKQSGSRTVVTFDANGDRAPDRFKPLLILNDMQADTLKARNFII